MRILAVDPGKKRIGLAISDPTGRIASPLQILNHVSRAEDASAIARIASQHQVELIVVGQSLDVEGKPTFEGRGANRLAAAIRAQVRLPVVLWDESFTTAEARAASQALGSRLRRGAGRSRAHVDDLAATVILQSYLDAQSSSEA